MENPPEKSLDKQKIAAEIYPAVPTEPKSEINPQDLKQQEIDLIRNYHANNENMTYLYEAILMFLVSLILGFINPFLAMAGSLFSIYTLIHALKAAKEFELQTGKKSKAKSITYIMLLLIAFTYFAGLIGMALSELKILENTY